MTAADILVELYRDRKPVKSIFDRQVARYEFGTKDRNLAMQIVYGVLRNREMIDRMITLLSRTPLKKLDPFVHQSIAAALFQVFFLDRIPDSAAVNEAVTGCKIKKLPKRLHGFVNGILREAIRQGETLTAKGAKDSTGALLTNHPRWLVDRWQKQFGRSQTLQICQANNLEPGLTLRINSQKISRESFCRRLAEGDIEYEPGRYCDQAVRLKHFRGAVSAIPGYGEGCFQVQDEAAQLATMLLGPFVKGGCYLDGCAGLGGKTSHLLEFAIEHDLKIHCVEPEEFRLKKLAENIERLFPGQQLLKTVRGSLYLLDSSAPFRYDGILIDAPCSGTGVTGRHPDIRWNRRPEDILSYQQEQQRLIDHGAALLKPGGILVYATCSLEPEENIEVVTRFLRDNSDFTLTDCAPLLPARARNLVKNGYFHPLPSPDIDGFFCARIRRTKTA
ncbi:16S rRNA (cytosine967-C5)-methyltransferase [Desulforhopalus singaporensis]|uniref:16S rRNA (cytosine(967)-C(5))-methyltransferase n=2 Tax=Desulforhopalus singaporensis TaxID=91360 RepID=A0A1H0LEC8_9BACT|nr:16S rRNA (cytosine967-C5)-methyltransferase [Desulforhopalus singaporensis]